MSLVSPVHHKIQVRTQKEPNSSTVSGLILGQTITKSKYQKGKFLQLSNQPNNEWGQNKNRKKKWGPLNFKIVVIISNDKKISLSKHKRPVALKEAILSPLPQFHLTRKPPKPPPNAIQLIKRSKRNTLLNLISK